MCSDKANGVPMDHRHSAIIHDSFTLCALRRKLHKILRSLKGTHGAEMQY